MLADWTAVQTPDCGCIGTAVGVLAGGVGGARRRAWVGVLVGAVVAVGVRVGVLVGAVVAVGVRVGVLVGDIVAVGVRVGVLVGDAVAVGVRVGVLVGVLVVAVGVRVGVLVGERRRRRRMGRRAGWRQQQSPWASTLVPVRTWPCWMA